MVSNCENSHFVHRVTCSVHGNHGTGHMLGWGLRIVTWTGVESSPGPEQSYDKFAQIICMHVLTLGLNVGCTELFLDYCSYCSVVFVNAPKLSLSQCCNFHLPALQPVAFIYKWLRIAALWC